MNAAATLISLALLAIGQLSEATVNGSSAENYVSDSNSVIHPYILAIDQSQDDHTKVLADLEHMSQVLKQSSDTMNPLRELAELAHISPDKCNHEFSSYWHRLSQKYRTLTKGIRAFIDHYEETQTFACEEKLASDLESLRETLGTEMIQLKALREAIAANAERELPTEPNRLYLEIPREGTINGVVAYLKGQSVDPLSENDDQKTFEAKFERNISQVCKDLLKAVEGTSFGFVLDRPQDGYDKQIEEMLSNAKICLIVTSDFGPSIAKASFETLTNAKSN